MRAYITISGLLFLSLFLIRCGEPLSVEEAAATVPSEEEQEPAEYAIVIHGGAGSMRRENMDEDREATYQATLNEALDIGEAILKEGGSSLDAVVATIRFMEDSPLFNAGRGAVFTHDGHNELDASIMDGSNRNAGAVGGVKIIRNPIEAARAVMDQSVHVMLTGVGAEEFAIQQGLDTVPNSYFFTQDAWNTLQNILEAEDERTGAIEFPDSKFGTVGCVALDKEGNLAGGTSTGGMTNKRYNRIGDSPIIGAGTYADNDGAAVSCTGHGEYFIRNVVAYDVVARMIYQGQTLEESTNDIIHGTLEEIGALGGLIAVDKYGNVSMPFNTSGMFRGYSKPDDREVLIFE